MPLSQRYLIGNKAGLTQTRATFGHVALFFAPFQVVVALHLSARGAAQNSAARNGARVFPRDRPKY